ncbi:MAG: chromate efflux transporter [Donghicola eburneus]|nr:chromate efflux transporter [Donghicola eburneus]MCI5039810.1 chromate efflux transporter [Donghicola eburneus]
MAPDLRTLFQVFGRIGVLSFGGPAAQIALMHKELVEDRDWLKEEQFLRALSFCMLLPGPEAMQLATYAGWRLRGTLGGLIAGLLFVIPGALVVAALALGYAYFGNIPWVQAAFVGIKATVTIIVLQALYKVAKRALHHSTDWMIAGAGFLSLFALHIPFPIVIAVAGIIGAIRSQNDNATPSAPVVKPKTLQTLIFWSALWAAPIALCIALEAPFFTDIALFFSKLAIVTFGGAYAVLAYMAQEVVSAYGWISPEAMIDALGLAETTPGPLILVTEFVALLAGFVEGGPMVALAAGALSLWVTFVPCFLWIFVGAPYLDLLSSMPRLRGALAAITAAVVGVILNLSIWFAAHVFFGSVGEASFGPVNVIAPDWASLDLISVALALQAAVMLLLLKIGIEKTLLVTAIFGLASGIYAI